MLSVARHWQASAVAIAGHGSRNSGNENSWDGYSSFYNLKKAWTKVWDRICFHC